MNAGHNADAVVVSIGSANVDFQVRADRWPDAGETLLGRDFTLLGGGKASNVAYLATRLGHPAILLACVGCDLLAQLALGFVQQAGVNLSGVHKIEGCSTGAATIVVRPHGDKTIILAPNANEAWRTEDIAHVRETIRSVPDGSVLVVDLELTPAAAKAAIEEAKNRRLTIVLDPSPADRASDSLIDGVDAVTPNAAEAKRLVGWSKAPANPHEAKQAAATLCERGARTAYVKLPSGQCVVATRAGATVIEPLPVEAVDTTGAGDAFAGGLAVALLEGKEPEDAARFAVGAASVAVSEYGSAPAYPSREELERRLNTQQSRKGTPR